MQHTLFSMVRNCLVRPCMTTSCKSHRICVLLFVLHQKWRVFSISNDVTVLWEGMERTMGNDPENIHKLFLISIHLKKFIFPKSKNYNAAVKNTASKHVKKSCNHTERARKATSKLGAASLCPLLISGTRIILLHAVSAPRSRNLSLSFRA